MQTIGLSSSLILLKFKFLLELTKMITIEELIKDERYKKRIDRLSDKTLLLVADDRIRALKWAYEQVEKEEPERKNDIEYLEVLADGMQKLARTTLDKRSKSSAAKS